MNKIKRELQQLMIRRVGRVFYIPVLLSAAITHANTQSNSDERVVEEVFVTALKQGNQSLADTPVSIAVIDGTEVEKLQADSLRDFLQLSSGVALDSADGGQNNIAIRGMGSNFGSASVGFYIDDLPFSFLNKADVPDPSVYDLKQVEVLKGPQGTLYGAGSAGGVVRIITNDPELDTFGAKGEAYYSTTKGGEGSYSFSGAINIPIIDDKLGLRAVYSNSDNGGWIDDSTGNYGEDVNEEKKVNYRVKLLANITDELSVKWLVNQNRYESDGSYVADDNGQFPIVFDTENETEYRQYGMTIVYEKEWATLVNITSYMNYDNFYRPPQHRDVATLFSTEIVSNEFRLSSNNDGPLTWIGGLFYRDLEQSVDQSLSFNGVTAFAFFDRADSTQYSIFGSTTYHLTDKMEVSVGGSYFSDSVDQRSGFPVGLGAFIESRSIGVDTDLFSPKVSFAYHPSENHMLYVSYSEGFRSGFTDFGVSTLFAQNSIPSLTGVVDAETVKAYEIGAKSHFFDSMLYAEIAIYRNDLEDSQQSAAVTDPNTQLTANTALNVGKSRAVGVDWSLMLRPAAGFDIGLSGAYVDAEVTEDFFSSPTAAVPIFAKGDPVNGVPEWMVNLTGRYSWGVGDTGLNARIAATLQYASERAKLILGESPSLGEESTRADLRFEIGDEKKSLFLFVENLTNEDAVMTANILTEGQFAANGNVVSIDGALGTRFKPRTLGVGFRVDY